MSETGYWRSCILLTAAHLGLFTWIGKSEKSSKSVAARFGGNRAAWEIFLSALSAMDLVRKRGNKFTNTPFASRYLAGRRETVLLPAYDTWQTWGRLAGALTGGKRPAVHKPFDSERGKAGRLLYALDLHAREIAPYLIAKLPLGRCRTLLDVGGGLGAYSVAFCRRYPGLTATLVEHPQIFSLARRAVKAAGMAKKVTVVGIDFLRSPLPRGFDAVFVSNALHAHGAAENRLLFHRLHRSLNPRGQLILRDVFLGANRTAPEWGVLFSVLLLLQTPRGRCYARAEIMRWLRQAGFSHIRGPLRSSPLPFDVDSVVIATKR